MSPPGTPSDLVTHFASLPDLHQSPAYARLMHQIGWHAIGAPGSLIYYRSLGPLTVAKLQRPRQIDPEFIHHFRRRYHPLTTYIESSLAQAYSHGFVAEPFAHSTTSLLDLTLTPAQLLSSFSQKTRYNITHSLKQNLLQITSTPLNKLTSSQLSDFFSLHAEWSTRRHVVGYPPSLLHAVFPSFSTHGTLHLAYLDHIPVGTLLILTSGQVATYYAAFATPLGYHHFAPTLLTWTALLSAQDSAHSIFDFGGIFDPRYPRMYKKWAGFTKFKAGFHPTVVTYPATRLLLFWK